MQDPARDALKFVLARYGVSIVDTPRSLATLLKQHAKTVPQDVELLVAAATHGVVQLIRDDPRHDPGSLARVLTSHGAASEAKAEWAVASWTEALAQAAGPKKPKEPASAAMRIAIVCVAAAAIGALAYLKWGR